MDLPNFPGVDPTESMSIEAHKSSSETKYIENILEQSTTSVDIMSFGGYYYSKCVRPGSGNTYEYLGTSTQSDFISNSFLRGRAFYVAYDVQAAYRYSGATFVRYALKNTRDETANKFESGMYCVLLPGISDSGMDPIFTIKNPNPVSLYKGTLTINSSMLFLGICATRSWLDRKCLSDNISSGPMSITPTIRVKLRIGTQWWNGSAFTSTEASFDVTLEGSGFNHEIPVTSNIYGEMELSVMPVVSAGPESFSNESQLMEIIITSLSAHFEAKTNIYNTDNKENHYLQLLNTNFRDEITIDTEFATNHNNIASPSLVMNDPTATDDSRYTETILYKFAFTDGEEYRRPEADLLIRLASYYGAARKRLELEMSHPMAYLSTLIIRGIEGVGNYLPLSESRDWQTGVCKLTCFETPS